MMPSDIVWITCGTILLITAFSNIRRGQGVEILMIGLVLLAFAWFVTGVAYGRFE